MSPSLPDPYINEGGWEGVQRNFDKLSQLAVDTGGQSLGVRRGSTSVTFTAASASNVVTVTHGLGQTPTAVSVTPAGAGGGGLFFASYANKTATTFQVQAGIQNGPTTGPLAVDWVAYS